MKKFVTTLVVMAAMLGVWGCEGEEWGLDWNIVGVWREINPAYYPYFQITLNADGSVVLQHNKYSEFSGAGAWHTADKTLTVSMYSKSYSDEYEYRQIDDRLTLITVDGYVIECIRVL